MQQAQFVLPPEVRLATESSRVSSRTTLQQAQIVLLPKVRLATESSPCYRKFQSDLQGHSATSPARLATESSSCHRKLQSQLKLKEEEIVRLNQRIEEHLKNIKSLKAEVNDKINKNITFCTNNLIENSIKSSNSVLIESYVNPSNCQKEDMTSKMNIYEDEINNLKTQICEQKQNFQVFKLIIYI